MEHISKVAESWEKQPRSQGNTQMARQSISEQIRSWPLREQIPDQELSAEEIDRRQKLEEAISQIEKAEAKRALEDSWVSALRGRRAYEQYTLETFRPRFEIPLGFPASASLYIHGAVGTGKTHLATALARMNSLSDFTIESPIEILRWVRGAENPDQESDRLIYYARRKVLVIDDLGMSKDTDWAIQTLYEIIDSRYRNMIGGLIVTSNLSLGDLAQKLGDDRIPSRLAHMCKVIRLMGDDKRVSR